MQDNERNTLTRGTFGYKNEFKMEISVSRRCQQRRTAQMLERSQSVLHYYNNIASLQDWYSTDHGFYTPLQDGDEPVTERVMELQHRNRQLSTIGRKHRDGCAKLSETIERWTSLALLIMTGEKREEEKQSNDKMQREIL